MRALPFDVTRSNAVRDAFAGLSRLDILVNNAGLNRPQPFLEVDEPTLDLLLGLNVRSAFLVAQCAARLMVANGGGAIINMSSQMGLVGSDLNRTVYVMTKHAVEGLTKAMAVELAPKGVRVVSIAPTFITTPLTQAVLRRPGVPQVGDRPHSVGPPRHGRGGRAGGFPRLAGSLACHRVEPPGRRRLDRLVNAAHNRGTENREEASSEMQAEKSSSTRKQLGDAGEMLVAAELTLAGVPALKMPDNWPGYGVIAQPLGPPTFHRSGSRSRHALSPAATLSAIVKATCSIGLPS